MGNVSSIIKFHYTPTGSKSKPKTKINKVSTVFVIGPVTR